MGCFSEQELSTINKKVASLTCFVGIKKLMVLAEAAKQSPTDRVNTFLCLLEEEAGFVLLFLESLVLHFRTQLFGLR